MLHYWVLSQFDIKEREREKNIHVREKKYTIFYVGYARFVLSRPTRNTIVT